MDTAEIFPGLHWLHHASFRVEAAGKTLYLDPYKLRGTAPADLIFVTHAHSDHYSPKDIAKIAGPKTLLVCPQTVASKAKNLGLRVLSVAPGQDFQADGVQGRAVPSYNLRKPMHPKKAGNVGYILDLPQGRLYHGGDTDLIPEMADFQGVRLALLPVGKILFFRPTMGPEEAAKALDLMQPEFASPMHYGMLPASKGDGPEFHRLGGSRVHLLEQTEPK